MRVTGFIRTYRGYDLFHDDDTTGEGWYAVPSHPPRGGSSDDALVVYPDEAALRAAIDATFRAPD